MGWENWSYVKKGAITGGIIGLVGSILRPVFWTMNSDPLFVFSLMGNLLSFMGLFGCDYKRGPCTFEVLTGYLVTIILFALIGSFIGHIYGKIKNKNQGVKK